MNPYRRRGGAAHQGDRGPGQGRRRDGDIEIIAAVTQLYREEGWYLERIYKWMDRTGLERIRALIMDDPAARAALYARFVHAQSFSQADPWAEIVADRTSNDFAPLSTLPMGMAAE